ncbi:hypothetical protein BHE74_00048096 [Ensete ventricosum]|nr:hypothetical protein GW17_00040986 [Ensete ventricosum]RWW46009.1 hypothetical protein BHE74_00048096 [Ensete ventricosum]
MTSLSLALTTAAAAPAQVAVALVRGWVLPLLAVALAVGVAPCGLATGGFPCGRRRTVVGPGRGWLNRPLQVTTSHRVAAGHPCRAVAMASHTYKGSGRGRMPLLAAFAAKT